MYKWTRQQPTSSSRVVPEYTIIIPTLPKSASCKCNVGHCKKINKLGITQNRPLVNLSLSNIYKEVLYGLRINNHCLDNMLLIEILHMLIGCYCSLKYIFTSIYRLVFLTLFSICGCRIPVIGPSSNWIWPELNDWMAYRSFLQAFGQCTHFKLMESATRQGRPNAKASKLVMCFGGVAWRKARR
jgi:hypothetical protein